MSVAVLENEALSESKMRLRRAMLDHREGLGPQALAQASERAQGRVMEMEGFAQARCIALFAAARGEPRTDVLAREVLARGASLAYPRVEGERLVFRLVGDLAQLGPGGFGLLEPPPSRPAAEPGSLDFVLVPGLAFDAGGGRLGYGKGFYDRLLLALGPGAQTVGFCHDFQLVEQVPVGPRDAPVGEIVTDRRHVRCH